MPERPLRRNSFQPLQRPGVDHVVGGEAAEPGGGDPVAACWSGRPASARRCRWRTSRRPARAAAMCSGGRSIRSGEALISSAVPVRAHAAYSASRSTSTGGRRPTLRVSGWPMMFTAGFSDRGDEPLRHRRPVLLEAGVNRRDADVEPAQEVLVPVDAAVGRDVQLAAVQQGHARSVSASARSSAALREHLLVGHPLHDQVGRVVGDRVVRVPARPRPPRSSPSSETMPSVRSVCVCRSPRRSSVRTSGLARTAAAPGLSALAWRSAVAAGRWAASTA